MSKSIIEVALNNSPEKKKIRAMREESKLVKLVKQDLERKAQALQTMNKILSFDGSEGPYGQGKHSSS